MRLLSLTVPTVSRIFRCAFFCLLTLPLVMCDKVPLTAPTGSTVTLTVNTTALPLDGTAQLTAVVVEASGTAPQNGTTVTFTSTLGAIEPREAGTSNGLATATFRAGSTGGTARIGAISGAASAEVVEITIGGGAAAGTILLNMEPAGAGKATVIASVFDEAGNPLRGVVVAFGTDIGQLSPRSATTDGNGEASTTLTTSARATVTARVGDATGQIVVDLTPPVIAVTLAASPNPVSIVTGQGLVGFTATATPPTNATILSYEWSFGDGVVQTSTGPSINHRYNAPATYDVSVRVRATNGAEGIAVGVVRVTP